LRIHLKNPALWSTIIGMRAIRQAILFGVVPMVSLPVQAQAPGVDQEIIALSEQWMRAVWEHDDATLHRLMADDFVYSTPGEPVKMARRQEWLQSFSSNGGECKISSPHVDAFGDIAILAAELSCPAGWEKLRIHVRSVVSDVWVRRGGQWRVTTRVANGLPAFGAWMPVSLGAVAPLALWAWFSIRDRSRQRGSLLSVANRY
jgi:ketosteroid isomerase-like protein